MLGVGVEQRLVRVIVWVENGAHLYNVRRIQLAGDAVVGHRDVRRRVQDARRDVLTCVRWRVHPDRTGLRIVRLKVRWTKPIAATAAWTISTARTRCLGYAAVILHCQPPLLPLLALQLLQLRQCSDRP